MPTKSSLFQKKVQLEPSTQNSTTSHSGKQDNIDAPKLSRFAKHLNPFSKLKLNFPKPIHASPG
jgi:hypothetical protein